MNTPMKEIAHEVSGDVTIKVYMGFRSILTIVSSPGVEDSVVLTTYGGDDGTEEQAIQDVGLFLRNNLVTHGIGDMAVVKRTLGGLHAKESE